ncbi:hypothetical protein [Terricaulis sp.]|uniref:hypothetical protein n=1 Tax=Terricaulis sp. TaxID=2768686 RepID=UPI003784E323
MLKRSKSIAAIVTMFALAACNQAPQGASSETETAATPPPAVANMAPLAYNVSKHSPLLGEAVRTAISQDFNGAPLSAPPAQHQITAADVRCRTLNPPSGAPDCSVTYAAGSEPVAITGEDASALFDALAAAGVQDDAGMGHVTRALTALECTVDDAVAQNTPANGDQVAGFSCRFTPA